MKEPRGVWYQARNATLVDRKSQKGPRWRSVADSFWAEPPPQFDLLCVGQLLLTWPLLFAALFLSACVGDQIGDPVIWVAAATGLAVEIQTLYWPISGMEGNTDFEARP